MTVIARWSHAKPIRGKEAEFPTPLVMREISEYRSPIDGRLITSRLERNEDCKRNDALPWEPGIGKLNGKVNPSQVDREPGKFSNPRFARKHGLPLSERGMERAKEMDNAQER